MTGKRPRDAGTDVRGRHDGIAPEPLAQSLARMGLARTRSELDEASARGGRLATGASASCVFELDPARGGRVIVGARDGDRWVAFPPTLLRMLGSAQRESLTFADPTGTWLIDRGVAVLEAGAHPDDARLRLGVIAEGRVLLLHLLAERTRLNDRLARAQGLVNAGMKVTQTLDLDATLHQIADTARDLIGARYAALGVLNENRDGLARFVWSGLSDAQAALIGPPPTGTGLLGSLIRDPTPTLVARIVADPRSTGFPPSHPPMTSFVGVPILVRGEPYGNLYLTDKIDGPFDDQDLDTAVILAAQASVAIQNAQSIDDRERRHAAERDRLRVSEELRALRLVAATQESERTRISRELHDESGQALAALTLAAQALERFVASEEGLGRLGELRAAIASVARRVHNVATDLRPDAIRDGLHSALRRQAGRLESDHGLTVELAIDDLPTDLPEELEITIFRVVQEAVTNVAKHSGATSASVVVSGRGERIRVMVEDDGRGFDPVARHAGLGLDGIRQRVDLVAGTLRVESSPDRGTVLVADFIRPREHGS